MNIFLQSFYNHSIDFSLYRIVSGIIRAQVGLPPEDLRPTRLQIGRQNYLTTFSGWYYRLHNAGLYARRPSTDDSEGTAYAGQETTCFWTQQQWASVLFTDESRFTMESDSASGGNSALGNVLGVCNVTGRNERSMLLLLVTTSF
ncbi:hypothetical protein TNCV_768771 [Trichonephila clavipes]|nr:hypothetical protein TNCV_768771 [Trichonephila clavipes]